MIETITFDGDIYPLFQTKGNMTQYARPFAKHFCKGVGYDIGYNRPEWKLFEDSIGIDEGIEKHDAYNLPSEQVDYIYSSHCLEHLTDWVGALEYWISRLKIGGVLFLYLPHKDQKWWSPWNNRKHKHVLDSEQVRKCMERFGLVNIFYGERDLNHSFMIVGEKR